MLINHLVFNLAAERGRASILVAGASVMARMNCSCVYLCLLSLVLSRGKGSTHVRNRALQEQEPSKLYLLSLLPYPHSTQPSDYQEGPYIFPGGQIAVELINNRSDILKGYDLELIEAVSGCTDTLPGVVSFVNEIFHSGKQIVGVIGPVCSNSAVFLSPLLNREDIALVNIHLSLVPIMKDGTRYPYSFGTARSVDTLVTAAVELMQRNNWYEIVILHDNLQMYVNWMYESFEARLTQEPKYQIVSSLPIFPFEEVLRDIQGFEQRIIFLMAGYEEARRIVCFALHQEMVYPKIQWVIFGMSINELRLSVQAEEYNCSGEEMISALNNSFFIDFSRDFSDSNTTTDLGVSFGDFSQTYFTKVSGLGPEKLEEIGYLDAMLYFDAVSIMALALNNSIPALRGLNLSLEDYGYGNTEGTKAIAESILDLDFASVSGKIKFDKNTGFVLNRLTNIYQIQGNTSHAIGQYNVTQMTVRFNHSIKNVIGSNFTVVTVYVPIYVIVLHFGIMTILLCITVAVHVLSIVYRDFESIKASSPNLNHLAYAGLYLLFVDLIMEAIRSGFSINEQAYTVLCNSTNFFLFAGNTLLLGTMCAKTWRLYRIFVHYLEPGPFLSSKFLITLILILVAVDIVLCILWTAINPSRYELSSEQPASISTADKKGRVYVSSKCVSDNEIVWSGILTGYQLMIGACALWLAVLSRHITLKNFNTRGVALLSYFIGFTFAFGFPVQAVLELALRNIIVEFVAYAVLLYIEMALFLVFLCILPIIPLVKQKVNLRINLTSFTDVTSV